MRESLAEVGISFEYPYPYPSDTKARSTTWFEHERGFGLRLYPTGREVYIVQTRMAGRHRTIMIAPSTIISQHQALTIARRVIAYAQVDHDPATDRDRIRSAPRFGNFFDKYWRRWSAQWKASTLATHGVYHRLYLDHAFPGIFIDEFTQWFATLNDETGPGAANRCLTILANMLTKAESWGYRLENTNPCRTVRPNRKYRCERFLSFAELERLGRSAGRGSSRRGQA